MYTLFALIRMLWPFLKETLFGRASFQTWLKNNRHTVYWTTLMWIMLYVVLRLVSIITQLSDTLKVIQKYNHTVAITDKAMLVHLQWSEDQAEALNQEVLWTRRALLEVKTPMPVTKKAAPTAAGNHNQELIDRLNHWQTPQSGSAKSKP